MEFYKANGLLESTFKHQASATRRTILCRRNRGATSENVSAVFLHKPSSSPEKAPSEFWHGRKISIPQRGKVTFVVKRPEGFQEIVFWAADKSSQVSGDKFIQVNSDRVSIRSAEGAIIWHKSISLLRHLKDGSTLLLAQYARELEHQKVCVSTTCALHGECV